MLLLLLAAEEEWEFGDLLFGFEVFWFVFGGEPLAVDLIDAFLFAGTKDWSDTLLFSIFSLMVSTEGEAATAGGCTLGRRGCMLKFILQYSSDYAKGMNVIRKEGNYKTKRNEEGDTCAK